MIEKLTPEQEALIPIIRDEWIKIGLDTSPVDRQKAEAAIHLAYECAGLKPPQQILWFNNPVEAGDWVDSHLSTVSKPNMPNIEIFISDIVEDSVVGEVIEEVIGDTLYKIVCRPLISIIWESMGEGKRLVNNEYIGDIAKSAYFNAIGLNCSQFKGLWETAKHCGWWWAYEDVAVVTPKPSAIRLDNQGNLHGEGVPAVAYEGFNVYAYHGVVLPEKYGTLLPQEWQAQWLLTEKNAELRRVLIQGIGYTRICQELQAVELDSWREYTLLKIDSDVDIEPIHLLKMTCPSTRFIHSLRVPPDISLAREAIAWVNWGIDPEEFAIQT